MSRVQKFKLILWTIFGLAAAIGVTRFIFGLGVTTNLTDTTPWGLWIGFDVMGGVALAAGGFVLTAIFYILRKEEFHPLVKPAVLTAFLGYIAVIGGLMFDLGLPWNIWHMIVFWNPHSPLFEVGWCVMLYTAVLLLEFSPVPLEEASRYAKIRNFLMKFRFPLVLLGIMLSTLHQSSLGSLFLIMPHRVHPLWYSSILPVLFFISAIALGMMMVSFESHFTHWLYKRKSESNLIAKLGKWVVWVLGIYLVIRFGDIILSGETALLFAGNWESILFFIEIGIAAVIPIIIFSVPALRRQVRMQWLGSIMVVFGMVFNRINVGGVTMVSTTGEFYVPSLMEILISLGVVSAAALVFLFFIERFNIWDTRPQHPDEEPYRLPHFSSVTRTWLGTPGLAARTKFSLAFIIAFAVGFALMPGHELHSKGIEEVDVMPARGGEILHIDGNNNQYAVDFNHEKHIMEYIGDKTCAVCHHMSLPFDENSRCAMCHSGMYTVTDMFRHDWHASPDGAQIPCFDCHAEGASKSAQTAKECSDCHIGMVAEGSPVKFESHMAPSYVDAMHEACISCHTEKAKQMPEKEQLDRCTSCHKGTEPGYFEKMMKYGKGREEINRVVLPGISVQ